MGNTAHQRTQTFHFLELQNLLLSGFQLLIGFFQIFGFFPKGLQEVNFIQGNCSLMHQSGYKI